ncbi:sensor histidine kinase [Aneurinibacillus migulanus]|uniref:histidine kinase n=1 Tax=Aneurinibacillus migulanus TaxID=47500 RepID=A0A0D1VCT6_ANEMI|nr:HAMP domain-containing sensor histidine kinase [Aneurinibacillus migulanus]KIV57259.1 histidine kinase [Aneurinibacillus migulanus]KON96846.1 histidine kinase [Aneurinibacillus migulanus]MED0895208.1 HAMP domain-containing sensor histidine kinase [Aneurinibacillus migulanus]MED1619472.1 HAMP domain-containing sensor histidine kinase [Aneurinibacillus migulanus]SDJ58042.1 hypothetical protein SAMN04487909_12154 [Aneurinibacillus migulanus]
MSIRNKIYLFSTVWLLLVLIIINVSIYFLFYKTAANNQLEQLRLQTENIAEAVKPPVDQMNMSGLLRAHLPLNGMIRIVDEMSHPMLTITKETAFSNVKAKFTRAQTAELYSIEGIPYAIVRFPIIWNDGNVVTLEVTESLASIQENMGILLWVLIVASIVVLIPSFLAGRMLGNVILQPISSMIKTMEEIQQKGIFKKLNLQRQSKDELYKLGNTFNKMMDILEQTFAKQQQFVSDASHELKTPLTVIESYASMLKRWGMKRPDILEESVEAIYSEAVRMKEMTKQMLLLADHDGSWDLNIQEVNIRSLAEEACKTIETVYGRHVSLHSQHERITAHVDEQKVKQLLFILFDNALKYSTAPIELYVGNEDNNVFITVKDYGIGIPKEELTHIFDRFYRVDKARSRETGGTGLGLSIAKRIVDAHGGDIHITSNAGEGTSFTVTLSQST